MNKTLLYSVCAISLISTTALSVPALAQTQEPLTEISAESVVVSTITLDMAIQKALDASPRLRSAAAQLDGARGSAQQAGVMPNPQIGIEAENIAGTGNFSGIDNAEITYGVSQRLELGGERGYRKDAAEQGVMQGQYDMSIAKLNLIRDVRAAYANAVAAQEMLALAKERKELEQAMIKTVKKRVNSASAPAIQLRKAEIGLSTATVLVDRLEREFEHTKHVLTSLWTGHDEPITLDAGNFTVLSTPPSEEAVESMLPQTADLKRWEAEKNRAEAIFKLEQAEAIPDPTISLGLRDFRGSNDQALVAGISFPIPVFDSNRGNIERARSMMNKAQSDQLDTHITMQNEVFEWLER